MKKWKQMLVLLLCICLTACTPASNGSLSQSVKEDVEELSEIGEVEVEDGVAVLTVTLPAKYAGALTRDVLNQSTDFLSTEKNKDGSVTIRMTKEQFDSFKSSLKKQLDTMIEKMKKEMNIRAVKYNDTWTQFDVYLNADQIGMIDSAVSILFYMVGGMYGIVNGTPASSIEVRYYGTNDQLLNTDTAK